MFLKSVSYPVRGLHCPVTVDNIAFRVVVVVKGATNSFFCGKRPNRRQFYQPWGYKVLLNLHAQPSSFVFAFVT